MTKLDVRPFLSVFGVKSYIFPHLIFISNYFFVVQIGTQEATKPPRKRRDNKTVLAILPGYQADIHAVVVDVFDKSFNLFIEALHNFIAA